MESLLKYTPFCGLNAAASLKPVGLPRGRRDAQAPFCGLNAAASLKPGATEHVRRGRDEPFCGLNAAASLKLHFRNNYEHAPRPLLRS